MQHIKPNNMLTILDFEYIFADIDTGEIIRQYHYALASEDIQSPEDVSKLFDSGRLASMVCCFKRGCLKLDNLSLTINFRKSSVF